MIIITHYTICDSYDNGKHLIFTKGQRFAVHIECNNEKELKEQRMMIAKGNNIPSDNIDFEYYEKM